MAKLLGIDVGTSGCKALLIDEGGRVLRQAGAEYPLYTPRASWSEQDPEDWWRGVNECMEAIGNRPDAIGVTGQMHGSVFLDAQGDVVRRAILWNDQRTVEECREIDETVGRELTMSITCNPPMTGFQLPKLLWLRNHELSNYQRTRTMLLPKDYIRYRLTGDLATEVSDASGTGAFNVRERRWAEEMMMMLEIDPGLFPPVVESDMRTGETAGGIPVFGGGGDQAAAAVGTGTVVPGIFSVSLGTSGVAFTAMDAPAYDVGGASHTFCHANRRWHAMGVMLSCGGALRWYRDTFCPGSSYDDLSREATTVEPGCDGLTFLPYLTGERCPINVPTATASFTGATIRHTRAHFTRAVFEGVSFGLKGCMDLLIGLGAEAAEVRVTSGGSRSDFWMQMLADVTQLPCYRLEADEGPALGAALLAGVGHGFWEDIETACSDVVRKGKGFQPSAADYSEAHARYRELQTRAAGDFRVL